MADEWKDLWQGQPPEGAEIVAEVLRQRADAALRTRRMERIGQTISIAVLSSIAIGAIFAVDLVGQKIAFGIAALWNAASLLSVWHGVRHTGAPKLKACVGFCRAELERRRFAARSVWIWRAGPVLLVVAAFVYPVAASSGLVMHMLPFLFVFAVWLLIVPFQQRVQMRAIDREIEELKRLERAAGL